MTQQTYIDIRIRPLDSYQADLEQAINEAYWNENEEEVHLLQKRMETVKVLRDYGEEWWVSF